MKTRKRWQTMLYALAVICIFWCLLTLWVQYGGPQNQQMVVGSKASKKALIVYNPDPIYNLDEQVCLALAKGLASEGIDCRVATTKRVQANAAEVDLLVVCANTYNWAPDWGITNFIARQNLKGKPVVAITLGSGSTERAKRLLEQALNEKRARLLASTTYWLLRPNDEKRMEEKNTAVACDMAEQLGQSVARQLRTF